MSDSYFQDLVHEKESNKNILTIKNKDGDILCQMDLHEAPKAIEDKK